MWRSLCDMKIARRALSTYSSKRAARKTLREVIGEKASPLKNVDIAQMLENFARKNTTSSSSSSSSSSSHTPPSMGKKGKSNSASNNNSQQNSKQPSSQSGAQPKHGHKNHDNNHQKNNFNNKNNNNNNNSNHKNNNHNAGNNNRNHAVSKNQPQQPAKIPYSQRRIAPRLKHPVNPQNKTKKEKPQLSDFLDSSSTGKDSRAHFPSASSSSGKSTSPMMPSQPQATTPSVTNSSHSSHQSSKRSHSHRPASAPSEASTPSPVSSHVNSSSSSSKAKSSPASTSASHPHHPSTSSHTFVPKPLAPPFQQSSLPDKMTTPTAPSSSPASSSTSSPTPSSTPTSAPAGTLSPSTVAALQALAEKIRHQQRAQQEREQQQPEYTQKIQEAQQEQKSNQGSQVREPPSISSSVPKARHESKLRKRESTTVVAEAKEKQQTTEPITRTTISDDEIGDDEKLAAEKHRNDEDAYNAMHELWTKKTKVPQQGESQQTFREMKLKYQTSELLDLGPVPMQVTVSPSPGAISQLATGLRTVLDRKGVHIVKNAIRGETDYEGTISEEFLNIVQPDAIDTSSIPAFVTSSRDMALLKAAQESGSSFMGSTSSTTGLLGHIILSLLDHRPRNLASFSDDFDTLPKQFTNSTRKPSCVLLRRRGKVMGIDNPPKYNPPSNKILIDLGKSLERMFTMEPDHFKNVMVKGKRAAVPRGKRIPSEPAMCVKMNSMMLRAQLDCQDGAAAGGGVFDLKTRAVLPIRLDCKNHSRYTGYHITAFNGLLYSFEREFFDMVRSTLLKYNLQVRIGQMQGIMVAYHNTQKIFGFEYVDQSVMDEHLYGSTIVGKLVFNVASKLLDASLNAIMAAESGTRAHQYRLITHAQKSQKYVDYFIEAIPDNAYADHPDPVVRAHYAPYGVDLLGVGELRAKLKELGVDDKGVRPTLVARLESALHAPLEADIPSKEFFESKLEEGVIKHFRLYVYLAQEDNMVDSLHNMTLRDLEEEDPEKFAKKNGVQVRYQIEDRSSSNFSAKRYHGFVRESIEEIGDEESRAAVAAEIPLNG